MQDWNWQFSLSIEADDLESIIGVIEAVLGGLRNGQTEDEVRLPAAEYSYSMVEWVRPHGADEPDDESGAGEGWLCDCGNFQEDGWHCTNCGAQPPWGCDCSQCDQGEGEDLDFGFDEEDFDDGGFDDYLDRLPDVEPGDEDDSWAES